MVVTVADAVVTVVETVAVPAERTTRSKFRLIILLEGAGRMVGSFFAGVLPYLPMIAIFVADTYNIRGQSWKSGTK